LRRLLGIARVLDLEKEDASLSLSGRNCHGIGEAARCEIRRLTRPVETEALRQTVLQGILRVHLDALLPEP